MTSLIIAKRYAKALLEIGRQDGNHEKYGRELKEVAELFGLSPELEAVLTNPAFDLEIRTQVLTTLLAKLDISPMVVNFCRLLLDRGRVAHLRAVNEVYARLLDEAQGITRAAVTTACALTDAEFDRLAEALREMSGKQVKIEVKEDPGLIGGVVARIGDLVLDGSVRTQLTSLKESLKRGEVGQCR